MCMALSTQSVSQTNKIHNLAHVTSSDPDKIICLASFKVEIYKPTN